MSKFKVYGLDVWGHIEADPKDCDCKGDCPGYEVNDRSNAGTVEIPDDAPDAAIVALLVEGGHLTELCLEKNAITVESSDGDFIEVNRASDGRYLLQLEKVE